MTRSLISDPILRAYMTEHPTALKHPRIRHDTRRMTAAQVRLMRALPPIPLARLRHELKLTVSLVAMWKARHRLTYREVE